VIIKDRKGKENLVVDHLFRLKHGEEEEYLRMSSLMSTFMEFLLHLHLGT
jgi:hypothetical protein